MIGQQSGVAIGFIKSQVRALPVPPFIRTQRANQYNKECKSADIRESEIFVHKVPPERIYEDSCARDLVSCAKERTSSC